MDIDAVLDPVIGKATMKKGRNIVMKIGDNEVEYDSRFRLYLQTKLSNPHYKPEINAQATLVNFCVTEKGLEDQLLALVVEHERPDLQDQARQLVRQLNEYNITLTDLENSLLFRLANSQVGGGLEGWFVSEVCVVFAPLVCVVFAPLVCVVFAPSGFGV